MSTAFDPIGLGGVRLANRLAMAPMTRSRAYGPGGTVTGLTATYYAQRAGAGLIVTEGIQPSAVGQGYPDTPGLHSSAQVAAWRGVTEAVHAAGGRIFAQLMHAGRIGHPGRLPDGLVPVGPSAVAAKGSVYTQDGPREFLAPQELDGPGVDATVEDFARAARNAVTAGFDGVEIHGGATVISSTSSSRPTRTGARTGGAVRPPPAPASASRSPNASRGRSARTVRASASRPATPSTTSPRPTRPTSTRRTRPWWPVWPGWTWPISTWSRAPTAS